MSRSLLFDQLQLDPATRKTWSSVQDSVENDSAAENVPGEFGSRLLLDPSNVYAHNAWDNVEWDESHLQMAMERIALQKSQPLPLDKQLEFTGDCAKHWDRFYGNHQHKFFKDRNWFHSEFPEIFSRPSYLSSEDKFRLMEVGCGAGNSVFPILERYKNDANFEMLACDFSQVAVDIVSGSDSLKEHREKTTVFQYDLSSTDLPAQVKEGSVDIILMVFVLSALAPAHTLRALKNMHKLLRPGGLVLFRDYGRYDLTQLRFKANRLLDDNFYVRGDGTQVYFFEQDELARTAKEAGFAVEQNAIDKRLLVNRKRQLKMYRCWLQLKFRKPLVG